MSKKSRENKRKRQEAETAATVNENQAALEKASQDAAALDSTSFQTGTGESETLDEANTKLHDVSRVISMREHASKAAKSAKSAGKAGAAKGQRKSAGGGLGKLPSLPRASGRKRERPVHPCECGCGGETKSRFCPGHDSYLRGLVLRVYRDVMTLDEVEKLVGGKVGKDQRAAVEREMKLMKKEGKLTKMAVAAATKRGPKSGKAVEGTPSETKEARAAESKVAGGTAS